MVDRKIVKGLKHKNIMRGIYLTGIIIFLTFFCTFVNAQTAQNQQLNPVDQGTIAYLTQTCVNSTYANISRITLPSGVPAINSEIRMTKLGNEYNYSFHNTSMLGSYTVYGHCDENGVEITWPYNFVVTPTGVVQSTAQSLASVVFLILMIALTFLFGWIGFRLSESKTLWILGLFFLFLSLLLMVYDVWLGYEYHRNFTGLSDSKMPEIIFYIFMFLVVAGFLSSLALLFLRWKELYRYYRDAIREKEEDDMDDDFDFDK